MMPGQERLKKLVDRLAAKTTRPAAGIPGPATPATEDAEDLADEAQDGD